MALSEDDAKQVVVDMLKVRDEEAERLNRVHSYLTGKACNVYVPKKATREYRKLVDISRTNIMPLVVSSFASNLFVEGYRPARASDNAKAWEIWQANRMDARQSGIYRAALGYGLAYATVLSGKQNGEKMAKIKPFSPRAMTAVYEDAVADEWPVYAVSCEPGYIIEEGRPVPVSRTVLYDSGGLYRFVAKGNDSPQFQRYDEHGLGVTPVVRWLNEYGDTEDGTLGEVEPLIPDQDQLNNTTFGLLMAQQYAAFKQRWVTGMTIEEDPEGNTREPFNPRVDGMLQSESPDTKFGEFQETNLAGYLDSRQSTLRIASAKAQLAAHAMLVSDGVTNLSAEALAALEAPFQRKIAEKKTSFGESNEQMLRLAAKANGDTAGWEDTSAQVVWRDTESRSLAQVADALGKMAQMLAIPPRALWERIPGVTDMDLKRWEKLADAEDEKQAEAAAEAGMTVDDQQLTQQEPTRGKPGRRPAVSGAPA